MANALWSLAFKKATEWLFICQMFQKSAISMLACAKIGAMHSVVYAGYSAMALTDRIQDAQAKFNYR